MSTALREELRELTMEILAATSPDEIEAVAEALVAFFYRIAPRLEAEAAPTTLPSGLALAPREAASCSADGARLTAFVRGVRAAVEEARRRFPGERIELLYAGTGPWAPLVVPLMTTWDPAEVAVTLLDVHAESLASVDAIVRQLEFDSFVCAREVCDAARFRWPAGRALHVVICEVIQRTLAAEPQVAVVRNLAPQLHPAGLLVPARVAVDFAVTDDEERLASGEDPEALRVVGTVVDLTLDSARQHLDAPPVVLEIPESMTEVTGVLTTRIETFPGIEIQPFASGLTTPLILWDLGGLDAGDRVAFRFETGERPGIRYRRLERGRL